MDPDHVTDEEEHLSQDDDQYDDDSDEEEDADALQEDALQEEEDSPLFLPTTRPARNAALPSRYRDGVVELPAHNQRRTAARGRYQPEPTPIPEAIAPEGADPSGLSFLRRSLTYAIRMLDKYQKLMEKSQAYWAAMLLHPGYKKRWVQLKLSKERQDTIFAAFETFYLDKYSDLEVEEPKAHNEEEAEELDRFLIDHDFYEPVHPTSSVAELEAYFKEPPKICKDPIAWWAEREKEFPRLSRMAFDILSIPAMSSEPERVFSRGGLVISSQRHSINAKTLETLLCLQHWLRDESL